MGRDLAAGRARFRPKGPLFTLQLLYSPGLAQPAFAKHGTQRPDPYDSRLSLVRLAAAVLFEPVFNDPDDRRRGKGFGRKGYDGEGLAIRGDVVSAE